MAGIWSRKFDYVNGETRVCKKCNELFYTMKPVYTCKKCANENQKLYSQKYRDEIGIKENYPFSSVGNEAGARFSKIRQKLRKAWEDGPEAVKEHYTKQLKEAEELGILKWIYDRRDDKTIKEKSLKSRNQTKRDWPDTRGYHEY